MPDEADLAMVALAGEGAQTLTSKDSQQKLSKQQEAETARQKQKAADKVVMQHLMQHLQVEKKDLQQKLSKQQEALDKAKLEIQRRTESVRSLKARSANLEQQLSMDEANIMEDQLMAKQQAHQDRKKQKSKLKAEVDDRKQEKDVSVMMQRYQNLVIKAKTAKALLPKEEKKAKEEVERFRKKHEDEENRAEQQILTEAKLQKDTMTAQVASYQQQLLEEKQKEKEAPVAFAREAEVRQAMKKIKQEEKKKLEEYQQEMQRLDQQLDEQKKVSAQKIEAARSDVQSLQQEVLEEEEDLKAKQAALQREQEQASQMEDKAMQEEKLEATKERELQEKVKESLDEEEKGKLVLQRQAYSQVAKLRKMISAEEALEKEQVEALERQIALANHTAPAEVKSRSFLSKL